MAWALMIVSAVKNSEALIVAADRSVGFDVCEVGAANPEDLGVPCGKAPGFWLWEGTIAFDNLDQATYAGETKSLSFDEAAAWMAKSEQPGPPDRI